MELLFAPTLEAEIKHDICCIFCTWLPSWVHDHLLCSLCVSLLFCILIHDQRCGKQIIHHRHSDSITALHITVGIFMEFVVWCGAVPRLESQHIINRNISHLMKEGKAQHQEGFSPSCSLRYGLADPYWRFSSKCLMDASRGSCSCLCCERGWTRWFQGAPMSLTHISTPCTNLWCPWSTIEMKHLGFPAISILVLIFTNFSVGGASG